MLSGDGFPDDGESGNSFVMMIMMMMMRLSMLTIMGTVVMIMI